MAREHCSLHSHYAFPSLKGSTTAQAAAVEVHVSELQYGTRTVWMAREHNLFTSLTFYIPIPEGALLRVKCTMLVNCDDTSTNIIVCSSPSNMQLSEFTTNYWPPHEFTAARAAELVSPGRCMIHLVFQNPKDDLPVIILRLNKELKPPKTLLSTSSSYSGHGKLLSLPPPPPPHPPPIPTREVRFTLMW